MIKRPSVPSREEVLAAGYSADAVDRIIARQRDLLKLWLAERKGTMKKIKALVRIEHGGKHKDGKGEVSVYMPGEVFEIEGAEAERLIAGGFAELVTSKAGE